MVIQLKLEKFQTKPIEEFNGKYDIILTIILSIIYQKLCENT